ncbi:MAG: hypothetical protein Q7R54_00715 [bacterium]|nr:hypothetical protein [bacterium]
MDLEDLNKSQLILLTVLVNFVTSVATGILTVSLLDTAPAIVTQTVNKIVERTIETVEQVAPATVIQAPKPSVEDLITAAFAALEARTVSFYSVDEGGTTTPALVTGTYLSKAHAAVTAFSLSMPAEVIVGFSDGSFTPASLSRQDDALMVYGFADSAKLPATSLLSLIPAKDLKIGQTALALTADGGAATGIVAKVAEVGITTTLPPTTLGASAVDLSGNLIGISAGGDAGLFISADRVRELLNATSSPAVSNL